MAGPGGAAWRQVRVWGDGYPARRQGAQVEYNRKARRSTSSRKEYEGPEAATQARFAGEIRPLRDGRLPRGESDKAVTGGVAGGNKGARGGASMTAPPPPPVSTENDGWGKQATKGPGSRVRAWARNKMPDKGW